MSIPVEYTPMSYSSLPVGKTFGPIKFIVEETSRARTLELLNANNLSGQKLETEFLLPSELWGLARVLSAYLGRLNEAILRSMRVRARLVVKPCEELTGTSLVARHWRSAGDLRCGVHVSRWSCRDHPVCARRGRTPPCNSPSADLETPRSAGARGSRFNLPQTKRPPRNWRTFLFLNTALSRYVLGGRVGRFLEGSRSLDIFASDCRPGTRTPIPAFKGRCPAIRRAGKYSQDS